jgi:hypothetical protein
VNENALLLISLAVGALTYSGCAIVKHGNCNLGKLFTLLVLLVGFFTGILLFVHVFAFVRANPKMEEDAVWSAVAGIVLCVSSAQEIVVKFRELFAKPVAPIKAEEL